MASFQETPTLSYRLEIEREVDLLVVTKSLASLSHEYIKFTDSGDHLLLRRVKEGSSIFELVSNLMLTSLFVSGVAFNTVADFFVHMRGIIYYLTGKRSDKITLDLETLAHLEAFIAPLLDKSKTTTIELKVSGDPTLINPTFNINTGEGTQIISTIQQEREQLQMVDTVHVDNVFLLFTQLNRSLASHADMAMVPRVASSQKKALFATEELKSRVLMQADANPFALGFMVDLDVQTKQGTVTSYTVKNVHGVILPDSSQELFPGL